MLTYVTNYLANKKRNFRFQENSRRVYISPSDFVHLFVSFVYFKFSNYYAILIGKQATSSEHQFTSLQLPVYSLPVYSLPVSTVKQHGRIKFSLS